MMTFQYVELRPGQEIRQHGWEGVHALIFILAKLYALPALQRERERERDHENENENENETEG